MAPAGVPNRPDWDFFPASVGRGERKRNLPWSPFPSLSSSSAVVLRNGGGLAQVETFYSPQKGPGICTRPLPSAAGAEILAVRTVLGAWRPTTQTAVVRVFWQGRCCRCLMTHAYALRNLVVAAVFRVALHANVTGWSPDSARESRPPEG
jgi:hypothetical protein